MPPVKTAASSSDVDNDATAELPVLDVAAYEATVGESTGSTDSWNVNTASMAATQATVEMQAVSVVPQEVIPTLIAPPEVIADLSGTHEMPPLPAVNKVIK